MRGCVPVIGVPWAGPPTMDAWSRHPYPTSTGRLDAGQTPAAGPLGGGIIENRRHRRRRDSKDAGEGVAVLVQEDLVRLRPQDEQPGHDPPWIPAGSPRDPPSLALVPPDLSLKSAEIFDDGLDLDDDQRRSPTIECEQVDPAAPSAIDDGHFSADLETGSVHPPIDVPRASSVHSVALATIADDHRRADLEVQFEAESTRQAHDDLDGRVRLAELDRGDI